MKKFGSFVLGVLLGAVTGSIIATLFAPTSGQVLRERLQDHYMAIRDEVNAASAEKTRELREELAKLQKREIPTE
ncbi:MAG: YtxH domain-containing protein [Anaerolineaceae bacterium]